MSAGSGVPPLFPGGIVSGGACWIAVESSEIGFAGDPSEAIPVNFCSYGAVKTLSEANCGKRGSAFVWFSESGPDAFEDTASPLCNCCRTSLLNNPLPSNAV
jgi:hypothetical protein